MLWGKVHKIHIIFNANQAYQSVVNTSKVTSTGEYASRRDFTLEESAAYLREAGASEDEIRFSIGHFENWSCLNRFARRCLLLEVMHQAFVDSPNSDASELR